MLIVIPALLAVTAGASVAFQQVVNTNLRVALGSGAWAGVISYAVGLACMLLLAAVLRDPIPSVGALARVPWWAWSGGFFGAIFVGAGIFLVPQMGTAAFIAFTIAGQIVASMLFDHYGILGLTPRPIDLPKLIGAALLVGGAVLIRF